MLLLICTNGLGTVPFNEKHFPSLLHAIYFAQNRVPSFHDILLMFPSSKHVLSTRSFYIGVCPVSGVVVRFVETMLLPNVYTTKVFLVVYVSTFARRIWFKAMLGKSGTSLSHRTMHYCEQYGLFIVRVYNKKTLT